MPNTTSAKKALRQSATKKALNVKRKNKFKSLVKEFRKSITAKSFDKARDLLPQVYKALDKAAKGNTIKDNHASRLKSRLTISLQKSVATK